jgi:hypothetical protein
MIIGFTIVLKKGKGELGKIKTFKFALMLIRGKMLLFTIQIEREQDNTT